MVTFYDIPLITLFFVGISHFSNLKEVVFDNNFLSDATVFPQKKFPDIIVLSLNNNKVGWKRLMGMGACRS